jgi:putative endonuclease
MAKRYFVYMMSNKHNTVLYIGITNDLLRRVLEHKNNLNEGFTKRYRCHKLVWYEETSDVESAIMREKQMKKWKREYKNNAVAKLNHGWRDLAADLF